MIETERKSPDMIKTERKSLEMIKRDVRVLNMKKEYTSPKYENRNTMVLVMKKKERKSSKVLPRL